VAKNLSMKKYFLIIVLSVLCNGLYAQRLSGNSVLFELGTTDARVQFKFYTQGVMNGNVESGKLLIENMTSHKLFVKVKYVLTDYCGNATREYSKQEVLEPETRSESSGAFFSGIDYETTCMEKRKYSDKISSMINRVSVYIESIEDLTLKEEEEKRRKAAEEEKARMKKLTDYNEIITKAKSAEYKGDYNTALLLYKTALSTGMNNAESESLIATAKNKIKKIKEDQEAEILQKEKLEQQRKEELEKTNRENAKKAAEILEKSAEELEAINEKKIREAAKELEGKEKAAAKKLLDETYAAKQQEKERLAKEKEDYKIKEQKNRRIEDEKWIESAKKNMSYDPIKYNELKSYGDKYYEEGMSTDPYAALKLDSKWWDGNPYMKSFREDLNEPRRKEAWQNCLSLLYEVHASFDMAKDYYISAIEYTDLNSRQYNELIALIESMNNMIDFQKAMIDRSMEIEQEREKNFYQAKEAMKAATKSGRQAKAYLLYSARTQGASYDEWNADPKQNQAVKERKNYVKRSEQAEKQLRQDEIITGVSTEIVTSAMFNDKTSKALSNNEVAFNFFTNTGLRSYPIVANTQPVTGFIPETTVDGLLVMPIEAGAILWLHRGKYWNLGIAGDACFGVLPYKGYQNSTFTYGSNLKLDFGIRKVKLAFEIDQHRRLGTYNYDHDVAMEDFQNPFQQATNRILEGKFNYKVLKVGAGLHIDISSETEDGYIRLLMFADKPSFVTEYNIERPILSFGGQIVFPGGITLGFNYAQNYPAAGTAENVIKKYDDRAFFEARVGKTWTIGKTKW